MKQSFYIGKEPDLQKIIIASAVLHILFLFLITIPMKTNEKEYKSYVVDLVAPAEIQSHTNSSRSSMKASPRKRVKAKTMPSQRVNREIERLQAISAISKLKDRKKEEKANRLEVVKKNIYEGPDAAEVAGKIEALRQKKLGV
ncbi:MAG TPA: hypothetical protein ENH18_00355, partial [Nitrospirae bacterium]|nr:hypothetical protein [Nitrospirota bacterium]HEW80797.1 hypothetical protein [Nitrospirota bacterium]